MHIFALDVGILYYPALYHLINIIENTDNTNHTNREHTEEIKQNCYKTKDSWGYNKQTYDEEKHYMIRMSQ